MRTRSRLLLGGSLLVALLGLVLLSTRDPAGAASRREGLARSPFASRELADDRLRSAAAVTQGGRTLTEPSASLAPAQINAEQAAHGVQLLAVHGALLRPVGPVDMWWWSAESGLDSSSADPFDSLFRSSRADEALDSGALRLEPDADGRYFAPAPRAEGVVVARGDGWWGHRRIGARSYDPTLVHCQRDTTVLVRVVDSLGSPTAGVRVALRQHYGGLFIGDLAVVETDQHGLARFLHFWGLLDQEWDFTTLYSVAIAEPLGEEVEQRIDVRAPPSDCIQLTLPPAGSVEVEVEGQRAPWRMGLELLPVGGEPAEDPDDRFADGLRRVSDRRVLFPFVGLGREFVVWSVDGEHRRPHDEARARGPTRAGEVVHRRVRVPGADVTVIGRVVGESGDPLSQASLDVYFMSADEAARDSQPAETRTDAEGRFTARFVRRWSGGSLSSIAGKRADGRAFRSPPIANEAAADSTHVDLWDVRVVQSRLMATGRVVDRDGVPVDNAEIVVLSRVDGRLPTGEVHTSWGALAYGARSAKDGSFEVWADVDVESTWLQAESRGRSSEPVPITRSQSGVEIVLDRDGVLTGRLLLPDWAPPECVHVRATARRLERTPATGLMPLEVDVDANGEFALDGLPAGEYDLVFSVWAACADLGRVERVQVQYGEERRDARLDPLDLRETTGLALIEIFGPDGKPVEFHFLVGLDEAHGDTWRVDRPGHRLLIRLDRAPHWIYAKGCALQQLAPTHRPSTAFLQPAPNVRLRLSAALAPLAEEFEFGVEIAGLYEPALLADQRSDYFEFDKSGERVGTLLRVGPLRATLWFHSSTRIGVPARFVGSASAIATTETQDLVIGCDPQVLADALNRLR